MKICTSFTYHQRVARVLTYICHHVDEPLSVDVLAKKAYFSPFHFHRIFRAIAGETVGEVIQRIRLEFGARQIRHGVQDMAIVAQSCGYESTQAFSRAFRRGFGIPPGVYRKRKSHPSFQGPLGRVVFDPETMKTKLLPIIEEHNMQIDITTKPAVNYAYMTHYGPYNGIAGMFDTLIQWGLTKGIDPANCEVFSLSYDSPKNTPSEQLRSDACVAIPEKLQSRIAESDDIKIATLDEQRYAVYTHKGKYDDIADAYEQMIGSWAAESNEQIADKPFVEVYNNDCRSLPQSEWLTDLCIPLKGGA
ncbi:MAG: helix-turn-helix domain-containing protein [Gammaproteobacteria bacterium]|nr:helix-turn-helix domain-containing protein [Gammaproteobacteria bacterium]